MAGSSNLLSVMRRAVELCMPDLRHYYRVTRLARVVASYPSDGSYYADVQPLRNDGAPDPREPVVPKVAIPVIWAGPGRGVLCPPEVGVCCDLSYYDGDPNYPCIANFRWFGGSTAACGLGELVVQQAPGVSITIDQAHKIVTLTSADVETNAGQGWTVIAGGNATIQAGGKVSIQAGQPLDVQAPQIVLTAPGGITLAAPMVTVAGSLSMAPSGGGSGSATLQGDLTVKGSVAATGDLSAGGVSLKSHTHGGVKAGGDRTSPP